MKGESGKTLTTMVPYGYIKDPYDSNHWIVDEDAAKVVKHIFNLCLEGRGPSQIAKQLTEEKTLSPTAYKMKRGCLSTAKLMTILFIGVQLLLLGFWNVLNTRDAPQHSKPTQIQSGIKKEEIIQKRTGLSLRILTKQS